MLKQLVQTLNEIRILLTDIYTREYVLESLRQSQKDSLKPGKTSDIIEKNLLTFDTVKTFLKSVVELMLQFNTGSS